MQQINYSDIILKGIKGLPESVLKEISDFILFKRKLTLQQTSISDELFEVLINFDLGELNKKQTLHLEDEFRNYDKKFRKK